MTKLTPDQRNEVYLLEAERTGIHKPILAALYQVQNKMSLVDGETGLGIAPANRITLNEVNTFLGQVQYAANTIRSITDSLINQGWKSSDLWNPEQGRYTDKFIQKIAWGYAPAVSDPTGARLEVSEAEALLQAYLIDIATDFKTEKAPQNLAYLDTALLAFVDRIPNHYVGLPHQRTALLEALRIWRKLDNREIAIASLKISIPINTSIETLEESYVDSPLLQFIQQVSRFYGGYPHQREALLRLVQLWRQLDARELAIADLEKSNTPESSPKLVDPALIAFVQRVPNFYQGKGDQRNALVEAFRIWRQLDSRSTALIALGVDPSVLASSSADPKTLTNTAAQIDRALLAFIRQVPFEYRETDPQREALIRLVQLWRVLPDKTQTIQSLVDDLKRMQQARRNTIDAAPTPLPLVLPRRPERWTPNNIQIYAPILDNGSFTWAEATHGGTRMPPDQATVDAMVRLAKLAQQARDRINRPFRVTSWYRPPAINARAGGVSNSRHIIGDAMDFYCDGLTGDQLYWALDPWWPGGLGRYNQYPYLSHIDARSDRARWLR
ncbi:MAG: D-Ala-D-Ala carboxypeptidase family metallohydrolase [Leptolyngbyaceae bacterium]|nr:D-Ala-D-Ala carboxypeptidase family metallohydrolase [Leptolyngbyaceae bacterium]